MKTKVIYILLILHSSYIVKSQTTLDSLVNAICQTISIDTTSNDSIRLFSGFVNQMNNYVENNPEDNVEEFWSSVFLRLQVKCPVFIQISIRLNKYSENWQFVSEMPPSTISANDCSLFYLTKKFKYVEPTGDTTILFVNKNYWKDKLSDGTFSKLKLKKRSDCEFDLTFVKSNNQIKNKLSQKGDKYFYRIIDRTDSYFLLCVEVRAANIFTLFKVYYK